MIGCIGRAPTHFFLRIVGIMLFLGVVTIGWANADNTVKASEFDELTRRLVADGFSQEKMATLFGRPGVAFDPKGISLFFVHSEYKLNYKQFLSKTAINSAARYMTVHKTVLDKAEKAYGVDKTIITAILLVETRMGTFLGNRAVINTLATMAAISDDTKRAQLWDSIKSSKKLTKEKFKKKAGKKSGWAYKELKAFLIYTAREKMDPIAVKGSYAGAMGISQFMPSNALSLAIDGNQDGKVDLFHHADAIHSTANYLKHHGWKPGVTREKAKKILLKYNYSKPYVDTLLKVSERLKG